MNSTNISISSSDKMTFFSNLSTMLSAGIPILETVDSLLEDAKGNQKKLLEELKDDLIQGKRLHYTFEKFPHIFDKVTVNIIKAAEEAGTLDITLKDLKENIKKERALTDKVRAALIYPIVLLFVLTAVFLLILLFVVPKISLIFERMTTELPLSTKVIFFLSRMLINYTIPVLIGTTILILGLIFFYRKQKRALLGLFTSLPLVSKLAITIDLTRFTRSMSLLLNAGITITQALELTEAVVIRKEIAQTISHCRQKISAGEKLSKGLKEHKGVIPTILIKMTEAGEKSGSLEKSMQESSEYLSTEVSNHLQTLTALLEPLMLIIAGVLIGGMMLSIFAPIYSLVGNIGVR